MITIDVLASHAEAAQKLKGYDGKDHRRIVRVIYDLGGRIEAEYRTANSNLMTKDKRRDLWSGVGKGFEISLLIELYAHEDGFAYDYGNRYPTNRGCCGGYGKFERMIKGGSWLRDLPSLAKSVRQRVSYDEDIFFGATIKPLVYTISERVNVGDSYNHGLSAEEVKEFERLFNGQELFLESPFGFWEFISRRKV